MLAAINAVFAHFAKGSDTVVVPNFVRKLGALFRPFLYSSVFTIEKEALNMLLREGGGAGGVVAVCGVGV